MRIVEPQKNTAPKPEKTQRNMQIKKIILLIVLLGIGAVLYLGTLLINTDNQAANTDVAGIHTQDDILLQDSDDQDDRIDYIYSGNEFRLLYESLRQPNVSRIVLPPTITGDDIADTRIREIAEKRGYKVRSEVNNNLMYVDGYQLQPQVSDDWEQLQNDALQSGLTMTITSAYRTINQQRQLFLSRLYALGVNSNDIRTGAADEEIDEILKSTALPGYSKHHTGYTIDLVCAGTEFENFKNSPCHSWLSANNYEQAKKYGFMPSYPPDADLQGPEPEAWEYVWVGTDVLYPSL